MDTSRIDAAVSALQQCKAQGKTYYEATQALAQQGFTAAEIEDASDRFTYSDITADSSDSQRSPTNLPPAAIAANQQQTAVRAAKQQLNRDFWLSFIPIFGGFFRAKQVSDYTKYQALRTGRSRLGVIAIWLCVMVIALAITLFTPSFGGHNALLAVGSHYSGVIVGFALLLLIFRPRNKI